MKRLLAATLLVFVGCADGAECDSDQVLEGGVCILAPASGGASGGGADAGGGARGGRGGSGGAPAGGEPGVADAGDGIEGGVGAMAGSGAACANLGDPCSDNVTHAECGCDAPFCAVQPGASSGSCTVTGCNDDPSLCPAGWNCLPYAENGFCVRM